MLRVFLPALMAVALSTAPAWAQFSFPDYSSGYGGHEGYSSNYGSGSSPYLVSPDGTYLGRLNSNPYDAESVSNPYGKYGSRYSSESINNPYGKYGSPYSPFSANNPYASSPPEVRAPCWGLFCD